MVAPRIRLAQVVATSLNPFSAYHVVEGFRSPIQFACGRTRPVGEIANWIDEEPARAMGLTEIKGMPVCRQCRRSAGWPMDDAPVSMTYRMGASAAR